MSEPVDLLMVSFFDKATVTDANRRFVHNRCIHKCKQVFQLVHFLLQLHKQRRLQALHNIFDMRQHGQWRLKCNKVTRIGGLITNPADETLQIVDRIQIFPQFFPRDRIILQFLYCIQPLHNFFFFNQWLLQIPAKHPRTHRCLRFIQHPKQRASLIFFT